jgi:hypothetical protein
MAYTPGIVPGQVGQVIAEYLARELRRIGIELNGLAVTIDGINTTISGSVTLALGNTFITVTDETAQLANSRRLVAGANVSLNYSTSHQVIVSATFPPTSPDLSGLSFVTLDDERGAAPDSRQLVAGAGVAISASATAVTISVPGGAVTIDDVRDALGADEEFRGEVIGSQWPGFIMDAQTDPDRLASGTALQEALDYAVGTQQIFRLLTGSHRFNLPGGLQIRAVGVDDITGAIVPAGTAGSTLRNPTGFTWRALMGTTLVQYATNTPILVIAPITGDAQFGIDVYGGSFFYGQNEGANTGSNAVILGPLWLCRIGGLRIANTTTNNFAYRGLYNPTCEFFFSNHIYDVRVFKATQSLLELGSTGTGNLWDNIYLSGVTSGGVAGSVVTPFRWQHSGFGQMHGSVFNQFNVEWCISNTLMTFANVRGATFNGVHLEQCRLTGANPTLCLASIADVNFNGLMVLDVRIETSLVTGAPCLFRMANDSGIAVDTMAYRINNSTYVNLDTFIVHQLDANGWDSTPGKVSIRNFKMQDSGTALRDFLRFDRTVDEPDHGILGLIGAQEIFVSPEPGSRMRGAEISRNYASVIYGAIAEDAFIKYPTSMSSTVTLGLSRWQGPAGTRAASVPVKRGTQLSIRRPGGGSGGAVLVKNLEDDTTLTAMATPGQTLRYTFDGARWSLSGARGADNLFVRYSASLAVNDDDDVVIVDASGGQANVSLPAIATCRSRAVTVKKIDDSTNLVIIDATGAETIDGAPAVTLSAQYSFIRVLGGSTEWHIIGR